MRISAESGLRSLVLHGRILSNIYFFSDGFIHLVNGGWLQAVEFDQAGKPYSYERDTLSIEIDEPVLARKIDLHRKCNFYVSTSYNFGKQYALYLYQKPELLGERLVHESAETRGYTTYYRVQLPCVIRTYKSPVETHQIILAGEFRSEKTEFGEYVADAARELEAEGIKIGSFELSKLLGEFDLIRKTDHD